MSIQKSKGRCLAERRGKGVNLFPRLHADTGEADRPAHNLTIGRFILAMFARSRDLHDDRGADLALGPLPPPFPPLFPTGLSMGRLGRRCCRLSMRPLPVRPSVCWRGGLPLYYPVAACYYGLGAALRRQHPDRLSGCRSCELAVVAVAGRRADLQFIQFIPFGIGAVALRMESNSPT